MKPETEFKRCDKCYYSCTAETGCAVEDYNRRETELNKPMLDSVQDFLKQHGLTDEEDQ
jgi:hypothetical protein